jgi:hypothetical protein
MKYKIKITKGKGMEKNINKKPSGEMTPEKRRKMEELAALRKRVESDEESEGGEETESSSQPPLFRRRIEEPEREKEKRPPPLPGLKDITSLSERIKSAPKKAKTAAKTESSLKIIEWGILGLLVWTPLAAGSVSDWAVLIIQLTVLIMAADYIWMKHKPGPPEYFLESLKWRKYFFFVLIFLIALQTIPLPKFLVKILSPNTYVLKSLYVPDFSQIKFLSLSVIPSHTLKQGLQFLVYILLGFLILKIITKRKQILRLFYIIVGMGVIQSLYGVGV